MTPGRALLAAIAPLVAVPLVTSTPAAQVYRGGTDVVYLSVTVVDGRGQLVPGLGPENFQVLEDGAVQEITTFSRDPQPIALSILVDSSTSMQPKMRAAQEAASGFVQRLGTDDVAQIIDFDTQVEILQTFTNDREQLEAAIRRTNAAGSTALYTAVYVALSEQGKVRARTTAELRRQAIVVLSDGDDTSSLVDYEQVLDLSKRSEVTVYAIGLRAQAESPRGRFNEADFVLRTLSTETGGRVFFVEHIRELPAVYSQIADELANQYSIGYTSTNTTRDGQWRRTEVRVNQGGVTARARAGYFGPSGIR